MALTFHDPVQLQDLILEMDVKFKRACVQVKLLNTLMCELQHRYEKARGTNLKSFTYCLRLRLIVSEGIRNAYYEYAQNMAKKIDDMEVELELLGVEPMRLYPSIENDTDTDTDMLMSYSEN